MTGAVKSSVFANQEPFKLPPDSIYLPIESIIARSAEGKADPERLATDVYARQVVEDVLRRTYGSVYRGNMAMMTSIMASIMPTFLLVSLELSVYVVKRVVHELIYKIGWNDCCRSRFGCPD